MKGTSGYQSETEGSQRRRTQLTLFPVTENPRRPSRSHGDALWPSTSRRNSTAEDSETNLLESFRLPGVQESTQLHACTTFVLVFHVLI